MLVVISDLHFEEEKSDWIEGVQLGPLHRNLGGAAFSRVFSRLVEEARRNQAKSLDLVLAGDIFDLHRTQLWFEGDGDLKPYVPCSQVTVGSRIEAKILEILKAIAAEPDVSASLAELETLATTEIGIPIRISFVLGNHDRLANATPRIRARVRELLSMAPSEDPFRNWLVFEDPPVLVRHGHEYDPINFSLDFRGQPVPIDIDPRAYGEPTAGDFITVHVAALLPRLFRTVHEKELPGSQLLTLLYRRLLEFDDVRPQAALLDYLLDTQGLGVDEHKAWDAVRPVADRLLDVVSSDPFLEGRSRLFKAAWQLLLLGRSLGSWLPLGLVKTLARRAGKPGDGPEVFAARETLVREGRVRFVVAGHTHQPQVAQPRGSPGFGGKAGTVLRGLRYLAESSPRRMRGSLVRATEDADVRRLVRLRGESRPPRVREWNEGVLRLLVWLLPAMAAVAGSAGMKTADLDRRQTC
jgi:UDP-2,3-diacylglucosamine pyrophosphatase LpxH